MKYLTKYVEINNKDYTKITESTKCIIWNDVCHEDILFFVNNKKKDDPEGAKRLSFGSKVNFNKEVTIWAKSLSKEETTLINVMSSDKPTKTFDEDGLVWVRIFFLDESTTPSKKIDKSGVLQALIDGFQYGLFEGEETPKIIQNRIITLNKFEKQVFVADDMVKEHLYVKCTPSEKVSIYNNGEHPVKKELRTFAYSSVSEE